MFDMIDERLLGAGVTWAVVAAIWLLIMPRDQRGRAWHIGLALAPLVVILVAAGAPLPMLSAALSVWLFSGLALAGVAAIAWIVGTLLQNHGVMDVAYPLAALASAITAFVATGASLTLTAGLLLSVTALWALRLSWQTWGHNLGAERQPYAAWRARHGPNWLWWSGFQVHLLQGVTIWIWCAPFAFAFSAPTGSGLPFAAIGGLGVWLSGFAFQARADVELARFRADPARRGGLLDTGVWSWVRHPNYLGETMMWAGYFVFALAHPWGWITLFAPLFNGWFMGWASAAPFKEHHMRRTRPQAWAGYCARTPRFLPWPRPGGPR